MDPAASPSRSRLLLALALGLGALADLLLYGHGLGLGATLFLLALPTALLLVAWRERRPIAWGSAGPLLGAYAFFAVMFCVRSEEFTTALNLCACAVLIGLLARCATVGGLSRVSVGGILGAVPVLFGNALHRAAPMVFGAAREVRADHGLRQGVAPVLRGLLLAIPVLAVFVPLLASADAVFDLRARALADSLLPQDWPSRIGRLLLVLLTAWLCAGGLVTALGALRRPEDDVPGERANNPLGFVEGAVVLSLVAALFASFLAIQAEYLFGGAATVRAVPGLTYAEYARRGFGEITLVATLTAALLLAAQRFVRRAEPRAVRLFCVLGSVLAVETFALLGSAWQRMAAYEAAYGLSVTRLRVDAFLVWLGIALCWLAVTLWPGRWERRFAPGGLLCALGFAATLNIVAPEVRVARHLAARAAATHTLGSDVYTLTGVSDDALPEALEGLSHLSPKERAEAGAAAWWFDYRLEQIDRPSGWQSWRRSRSRARRALLAARERSASSLPGSAR